MRRLRLLLFALAVVLSIPLLLLVRQVLRDFEMERALEHRTVAERVIDEMERELSAWLTSEEDRPYSHYRFFFEPEDADPEAFRLLRSPLSEPPALPFVIAYFQRSPGGELSTPLRPGNEQLAMREAGWQDSEPSRTAFASLRSELESFWRPGAAPVADRFPAGTQPGSTVALNEPRPSPPVAKSKEAKRLLGAELEDDALAALGSLNRGARARQQRVSKQEPSQATQVYNFSRDDNAMQSVLVDQQGSGQSQEVGADLASAIEQSLATEADATIEVHLEPMVGRANEAGHWVLYRTVLIGQEAFRQGMVIDPSLLVEWVAGRALADSRVARVQAVQAVQPGNPPPAEGFTYLHRFAAPFDGLAAMVAVGPLAQSGGGRSGLLVLSALLVLAALAGFIALDRMVAVTVSFAQRRSNFVSAVTHELKTPLTALRMYGEMLRDGVVPSEEKRQQYYEIITRESERLTRLVNNVLELSRLEKGRHLSPQVGQVLPVVREVAHLLRPHLEQQGFALEVNSDDGLSEVSFDRDALLQVLFNLVDNAVKYSRQATERTIELSCRATAQGGVELLVSDHGPGVPRRHLRKIFEPFYRAQNELTRTTQGTGIGLALVRGLVDQMGGSVTARNRTAGGFEVRVALPAIGSARCG